MLTSRLCPLPRSSSQIGESSNTVRDFGHTKVDGITGKEGTISTVYCVDGSENPVDCVTGADGTLQAPDGAHTHGSSTTPDQGGWFNHSDWMQDDQMASDDFVSGGTGMYGHFAIHTPYWVRIEAACVMLQVCISWDRHTTCSHL